MPDQQHNSQAAKPERGAEAAVLAALESARNGETEQVHAFIASAYAELRRYAARLMQDESTAHTFSPTDLVNEAEKEVLEQGPVLPSDRGKSFSYVATLMRRILIDHARAKKAQKRGGDWKRIPLTDDLSAPSAPPDQLVEIDKHIKWLAGEHPEKHQIVMLHFYGGLTFAEIAAVIKVDERTVYRRWAEARELLLGRMNGEQPGGFPEPPTPGINPTPRRST